MTDRREMIARGIEECTVWTGRYLVGFDDRTCLLQPENLPNHVTWSLGHCALTMHRVAEKFDGAGIPESDFTRSAPAAGSGRPERFWTESVAFGSTPAEDPLGYPTLARATAVFNAACARLAGAIRGAPDAKLDERTAWGAGQTELGVLALRMIFHNGDHTGQIVDTRRALKMDRVLK
jgi:hypothetical protein